MEECKKLYYEDAYIKEFDAHVLCCEEGKDGFLALLDQTAFYPEGGGQPSDTGFLGDIPVSHVGEKNGQIWHAVKQPVAVGSAVHGKIDWERRFDLMQQHSGEHMVSGLIHKAFGYDNVGFHMGSEAITIDLNGPISEEQLSGIEEQANRAIWLDREVRIFYPDKEELPRLPYRSKKELTGQVRLVEFPDVDLCACCGTHVRRTGEIGLVKFLSMVKFREGVRIEMVCGERALKYFSMLQGQNHQISVLLSAKMGETAKAAARLYEEASRLKELVREYQMEDLKRRQEMYQGAGDVLLFEKEMDADTLRRLTDAVMTACGGRCAVFSANPDGSHKYAIGEKDGDLKALVKDMNAALNGRGGGKPFFVQGSVQAGKEEIEAFFRERG